MTESAGTTSSSKTFRGASGTTGARSTLVFSTGSIEGATDVSGAAEGAYVGAVVVGPAGTLVVGRGRSGTACGRATTGARRATFAG
jgi:hypothetical protein